MWKRLGDWRDFVRGVAGELVAAGFPLRGASLEIDGSVPEGAGLSSSAALEVALALAMLALAGVAEPPDRVALAKLCSRVENDWVGAETGLLDQLASLCGEPGHAIRIDFRTLDITPKSPTQFTQTSGDSQIKVSQAELGELLAGTVAKRPARHSVFKSLGIAVEDIAAARLVCEHYHLGFSPISA